MVFTVFRLLTDFVCLYTYEFWLSLCKIVRSSVILLLPLYRIATFKFYSNNWIKIFFFLHLNGVILVRSGREGNKQVLRNILEINKISNNFGYSSLKNPSPTLSSKTWAVPNKSVTTTKQDISHRTNKLTHKTKKYIAIHLPWSTW